MVYVIYERLKGEESFYRPYFDTVELLTPTCYWSDELLQVSDLQEFYHGVRSVRLKCDEEWASLKAFFDSYPEHFDPS